MKKDGLLTHMKFNDLMLSILQDINTDPYKCMNPFQIYCIDGILLEISFDQLVTRNVSIPGTPGRLLMDILVKAATDLRGHKLSAP